MAQEDNAWEDNEFDAEFEDDNDDEFNQDGNGWESSNENVADDPFEDNPNIGDWDPVDIQEDENGATEIENAFWRAYYEKSDKEAALESFLSVIKLVENGGEDTDDFKFKSLTEIVVLYFNTNHKEETARYFEKFLECSKTAKPSDLSSNLRKILNAVKVDESVYNKLHSLTMKVFGAENSAGFTASGTMKRLYFELGIERCHDFVDKQKLNECQLLIQELHENVPGNDQKQTAKLLQVYAVKIRLTMGMIEDLAMNDQENNDEHNRLQLSLRDLIEVTQRMMTNVAMMDNKSMSIIYECWGKVFASSNDWVNAYKYFKESFLLYQQIAHKNTTKCLKYLLISYMILSSLPSDICDAEKLPNPFAMDEIKVYQNHHDIITMNHLLNAFEDDDISKFNQAVKMQHDDDVFIAKYVGFVQLRLQGKALINLVSSYDRVKLKWLCGKLGMTLDGIERLIVRLIVDEELNGRLDQVNMLLILKERENTQNAVLNALQVWLRSVNGLRSSINSRASQKTASHRGFGDYFDPFQEEQDFYVMDPSFLAWD